MARYKHIDVSPRFLAVDLKRQLLPGSRLSQHRASPHHGLRRDTPRPSWQPRSDLHGRKPITLLIESRSLRACGCPCADSMSARALRRSHQMPDIRLQPIPALTYLPRCPRCVAGGVHIRG